MNATPAAAIHSRLPCTRIGIAVTSWRTRGSRARSFSFACAGIICAAVLFTATTAFAQSRSDGNAPQALEIAPSSSSQLQGTTPADANGLRVAPANQARPAPANRIQPSAPQAPATPDVETIVRTLTNAEPLQPPRDILRTGYWQQNGYWLLPLLVVVALAATAIAYLLRRRSRRPVVLSPQLLALHAIENAEAQTDDKRFAIDVSNAVRGFLEARFQLRAPEQTTEEFLQEARNSSHLPQPVVDTLAHLLQLCDLAKFARQGLPAAQRTELAETAILLVNSLEQPQIDASQSTDSPRS